METRARQLGHMTARMVCGFMCFVDELFYVLLWIHLRSVYDEFPMCL